MSCKCPQNPREDSSPVGDKISDSNVVLLNDVKGANEIIKDGIIRTLLVPSHLGDLFGIDLYLKLELFQFTGSFKERGARNVLANLSAEEKQKGIVTASTGNYGQAIAYHGKSLGINVTIVMPETSPLTKIEKCKNFNANVIIQGNNLAEAEEIAKDIGNKNDLVYIDGGDNLNIIAGQGTCALEIIEDLQDIDAVIIPCGSGGLLAGCSVVFKKMRPNTKIIGVEPKNCSTFTEAFKAGKPVDVKIKPTLADSLSDGRISMKSFESMKDKVDKIIAVEELPLAVAMLRLIELEKIIVEGAAAATLAAVVSGQLEEFKGKKVVLILTGGNVDTIVLRRCLDRGLSAEGRLVKLKVLLDDKLGVVTEFCRTINDLGVPIKDIYHERAWMLSDIFKVSVKVICETRDYNHSLELKQVLTEKYKEVYFVDFPEDYVPPPLF